MFLVTFLRKCSYMLIIYIFCVALTAFLANSFIAVKYLPFVSKVNPRYLKYFTFSKHLSLKYNFSPFSTHPCLLKMTTLVFSIFTFISQSAECLSNIVSSSYSPSFVLDISTKSSAQKRQGTVQSPGSIKLLLPELFNSSVNKSSI